MFFLVCALHFLWFEFFPVFVLCAFPPHTAFELWTQARICLIPNSRYPVSQGAVDWSSILSRVVVREYWLLRRSSPFVNSANRTRNTRILTTADATVLGIKYCTGSLRSRLELFVIILLHGYDQLCVPSLRVCKLIKLLTSLKKARSRVQ